MTKAAVNQAKDYSKQIGKKALRTFWTLVRIMLPVMVLVRIGEQYGATEWLGHALAPVMALVGLPPEAGLVFAITLLIDTYGGIGAYLALMPSMEMTVAQHSILCAMMLIAHSIPVEAAIIHRAGANFLLTSLLRLIGAFLFGFITWQICQATGWLSAPLELSWAPEVGSSVGWLDWSIATASSLAMIFCIIVVLLIFLDGLERIGVIGWFTRSLEPLLKLIGIDPRLAPATTIGLLLGITYGGGLLIQAAQEHPVGPRAKFLALSLLCLSHGIVEDTLLFIAFGADVWIILVGRVAFTIVVVALMAWLLRIWPRSETQALKQATQ
ncbi:MAG: nucleoside recognition domain-containing protein [Pseudomonadota bacterium]